MKYTINKLLFMLCPVVTAAARFQVVCKFLAEPWRLYFYKHSFKLVEQNFHDYKNKRKPAVVFYSSDRSYFKFVIVLFNQTISFLP